MQMGMWIKDVVCVSGGMNYIIIKMSHNVYYAKYTMLTK